MLAPPLEPLVILKHNLCQYLNKNNVFLNRLIFTKGYLSILVVFVLMKIIKSKVEWLVMLHECAVLMIFCTKRELFA